MPTPAEATKRLIPLIAILVVAGGGARAEELAWLRILSGSADPVTWQSGEKWPSRPSDFPFFPSAVLSYAPFAPGDSMPIDALRSKARDWERSLQESGRFAKASVFLTEPSGDGRLGAIAEVEPLELPLAFDGGAAYGVATFPLAAGRRAALSLVAGANKDAIGYRDEALGDHPLVLEAGAAYDNDLLETGKFDGNRLSALFGLGPRIGPLGSLTARIRGVLPLDAGEAGLLAVEGSLDFARLALFGAEGLDGFLDAVGSAYLGSTALRGAVSSELRLIEGDVKLEVFADGGLASAGIDTRERFDLGSGGFALEGPEGEGACASRLLLGRFEFGYSFLHLPAASWFALSAGPFAFAEAALGDSAIPYSGCGLGLRLVFGPPVGITADMGYAFGGDGSRGLVLSVTSERLF